MGFTYFKCTTHFHESSRIRSSVMMRENGTDHCNVVDKVSLPRRPEFDFARNLIWCCNFIMIRMFLCFCNTESKSFGRCCLLDRSKDKKITYRPFLLILINKQLEANSFYTYLFRFSTCFEQPCAHHQESQLYQYIWYMSLCVGDIYQMLYWYNWISWRWAQGSSKHVENRNKYRICSRNFRPHVFCAP
jgi:hypothetical protein